MSGLSLIEAIQSHSSYRGRIAVQHNQEAVSYQELLAAAQRIAAFIRVRADVRRLVLVCLPNSVQLIETILGCFLAGASCALIDPSTLRQESFREHLRHLSPGLIIERDTFLELPVDSDHGSFTNLIQNDFPALIVHTSGSTDQPKAVVHNFSSLDLLARELSSTLKYTDSDKSLVCLQICRPFGLTSQVLPALYAGASLVVHDEFDASSILNSIREQQITRLYFYPQQLQQLVSTIGKNENFDSVKTCVVGAGHSSPVTNESFRSRFGVRVIQSIGMVETLAYAINISSDQSKAGSAGTPICGAQVRILDDNYNLAPPGECGEIVVNTPLLMSGYFGESKLRDEWFRTGDIGYVDGDGYLWYVGRKSTMVDYEMSARERELTDAILQIEGIAQAVVIGTSADSDLVALVCLSESYASDDIIANLETLRTKFAMKYKVVTSLPQLLSGKLDMKAIRDARGLR